MSELIQNPLNLNENDLRKNLSNKAYQVLREAATEAPFSGEYETLTTPGTYSCKACGAKLFDSTTKFDAHCGWPAFFAPLADDSVRYLEDTSMGVLRVEVRCKICDSHLGHVFSGEKFDTPTDQRYCINSIALDFEPTDSHNGATKNSAAT